MRSFQKTMVVHEAGLKRFIEFLMMAALIFWGGGICMVLLLPFLFE